jgi:hypothetical protein
MFSLLGLVTSRCSNLAGIIHEIEEHESMTQNPNRLEQEPYSLNPNLDYTA